VAASRILAASLPQHSRRQRDLGWVRQCRQGPSLLFFYGEWRSQERSTIILHRFGSGVSVGRRPRATPVLKANRTLILKAVGVPHGLAN
jgi:hypothetical protein